MRSSDPGAVDVEEDPDFSLELAVVLLLLREVALSLLMLITQLVHFLEHLF